MSLTMVFIAFFLMLGPGKMIFPYAKLVGSLAGMERKAERQATLKAIGIATVAGIIAGLLGQQALVAWHVSLPALKLATGIMLFLVGVQAVLQQYVATQRAEEPGPPPKNFILSPLVFPLILSPYGSAALILILATSDSFTTDLAIYGLFLAVMALNLLTMWFVRSIVKRAGMALLLLGSVLGVLQVAIAIQIVLNALRDLKIIPHL